MSDDTKAIIVPEKVFKGKVPAKYWQEVSILKENGFGSRKIAATLNEKYGEDFTYSNIISLFNFLNEEKKTSIESDFLTQVQNTSGDEMQRVESLYETFIEVMEECKLIKDYGNMFKAGAQLSKLLEIKMKAKADVITSKNTSKEPTDHDKEVMLSHVLKKLQLGNK